jgi:hypothetical protein
VTIKDANEVNLINAFFGGGPSLTDCVDISESGTTTGGIRVTGRILFQQCSNLIDNTITGITISSSSVAGDFDYEFHGTQGQKYIDSPSAAGGTTIKRKHYQPHDQIKQWSALRLRDEHGPTRLKRNRLLRYLIGRTRAGPPCDGTDRLENDPQIVRLEHTARVLSQAFRFGASRPRVERVSDDNSPKNGDVSGTVT